VLGLIALSGLTAYGIGWDTIIRPSLDGLQSRDKFIKEQNEALQKRLQLQHEYGDLEQKLTNLDTHMLTFHQGSSSKIVSVTEAAELTEIAMGKIRAANLPPLQPPHNIRDHIELKPIDSNTLDILHPNGEAVTPTAATTTAPAAGAPGAVANSAPNADTSGAATTIPIERYNYDLSVTGTYPALMDLLNQFITRKKLLKINKVSINKSTFETTNLPDPKVYPDYPLKLDMVVSLSMFLYEDNSPPPAAQ
jgi:hypothetical protein